MPVEDSVDDRSMGNGTSTHFADEEDGVALAATAGLVLDLEVRDGKRIANGLL